jgi:peptidyl-prolyl cis-trans isomerase SurA
MKKIVLIIVLFVSLTPVIAQDKVIDQIIAVVGSKMIKLSDIENQYEQYVLQGYIKSDTTFKCVLFEELLFQKLLLNQADIDSVTVTDTQVETDLDRRLNYFAKQMGGFDALEKFYNKTTLEIKNEFREIIKDQLLQQTVEAKITDDIKVTPSEVKAFFNSLPADSIPTIGSEVEVGQIVKEPVISDAEKTKAKEKLTEIRDRILKGEDFSTLAILYSEDESTATKGGEVGFSNRGELDPDFEAAAFKLKEGEVSPIVLSEFGYHIIQLIERRGEMINVRHILIIPKVATEDLLAAKLSLDTVYEKLKSDSLTFEAAAKKYSDDPSKNNGGIMVNTETGTSKFEPDQLDVSVFYVIDKLKPGEYSQPVPMKTDEGKQAYRILYLKTRTDPHRANMKEDYDKIQEAALKEKQNEEVKNWIKEKAAVTYIHIIDEYLGCDFTYDWFAKP